MKLLFWDKRTTSFELSRIKVNGVPETGFGTWNGSALNYVKP